MEVLRAAPARHAVRWPPFVAFCALSAALALVYAPGLVDLPVARLMNSAAGRSPLVDLIFRDIDFSALFSGLPLAALIWGCWFAAEDRRVRSRLLVGTALSLPIGVISRLLQHVLPTHPRPFYDPALRFRLPATAAEAPLNTWNGFPSDHAAVLAALLASILLVRPRLAWILVPGFVVVESARIYVGAHYPSDLVGGAALGAFVVLAAQAPPVLEFGRGVLARCERHPFAFYALAFVFTCEVAHLLHDERAIGGDLRAILLGPR